MWLPKDQWKGVFHSDGNGGYGGIFDLGYPAMETAVKRGYASATTDMGTAPSNPLFGDPLIGHPQKWKDWGSLSTHVMTVVGKAIAKAFYGEAPKRSYYTGCSTGGQQGLIEAKYYPEDYDGILIGAPVVIQDLGARRGRVGLYRRQSGARPQDFGRQAHAAAQGGRRGLRRQEERAQVGSVYRRSRGLRLRPGVADVQRRRIRPTASPRAKSRPPRRSTPAR